jgi:acyl carrier protein
MPSLKEDDIREAITASVALVQSLSGREGPRPVADTKPIGDLDGFDSLCSIETTVLIETTLGVELGSKSIFISDDGRKALTIQQAAEKVLKILAAQNKGK